MRHIVLEIGTGDTTINVTLDDAKDLLTRLPQLIAAMEAASTALDRAVLDRRDLERQQILDRETRGY